MRNFEADLKKYNSKLRYYANKYSYRDNKPSDHKDDMYQEACIALWYAGQKFDPNGRASFGTYLKRVLWTRLWNANAYKKYGYKHTYPKFDYDGPVQNIEIIEPKLGELFKQLSERDRVVLEQLAYEDGNAMDLKSRFKVSNQLIAQWRKRALKRMKRGFRK